MNAMAIQTTGLLIIIILNFVIYNKYFANGKS